VKILVTGASGFVGSRLCAALVSAGHDVRAMTRNPDRYGGAGEPVAGDVHDAGSLGPALHGSDVAYYLVHSLSSADFVKTDAEAASNFGAAAADAGVNRIVYLGGLGADDDQLSPHLKSRRQVEGLLGQAGVPVTTLRAGIIVGHGGISWEMTRQLVEHLPAMVTPRWVSTKTQPIGIADVIRYLVGVLDTPETVGQTFEIGGPEVLEYREMMTRVASLEGRRRLIVPVPLLSPRLSSRWLSLVTDVDAATGRSLVDSMTNEVVVRDGRIRELIPFDPMGYDDAVLAALAERAADRAVSHDIIARRRKVVAATAVAGAGLLGASLSTEPGSRKFYALTLGVAGLWTVGGLSSGRLPLGDRRDVVVPVATGAAAFGAFYAAALAARRVPPLRRALVDVMQYANEGSERLVMTTALANGVAEEVFFRGAIYAAAGRQPVVRTTAAYTLATTTTRNPALVLASAVMGALFGLQRRATGGIQAPILTHVTWSALMLRFLPRLFRRPRVELNPRKARTSD